jgi:hypothetical protein
MPSGYPALPRTVLFQNAYKRARSEAGREVAVGRVRAHQLGNCRSQVGCSIDNKLVAEIGKRCLSSVGQRRFGAAGSD